MMTFTPPLLLASQSPRRASLLRDAGVVFEQRSPPFADPDQPPGHLNTEAANAYAQLLAVNKAKSLAASLDRPATILAADTICVDHQGALIGKPVDRVDAQAMLRRFMEGPHQVITGVALLRNRVGDDNTLTSFVDTAQVQFGVITDQQLAVYLEKDEWRDKAGGYNLFDRQARGWPITVAGDPTTVVGLPMRRLMPLLSAE